jgi:prepilin-type N-terminal cleavage/methylation domain-containing protein
VRRGQQGGFTLVELLVAMVLMLVLILAVMGGLDVFGKMQARTSAASDAQGAVRGATDRLARELRNGAVRNPAAGVVQRAQPTDLVFATVDATGASPVRVRYCVDATPVLWRQQQAGETGASPATACPDPSWGTASLLVGDLVPAPGATAVLPFAYDADLPSSVTRVWTTLSVRPRRGDATPVVLGSGVTLRNQNRSPVASFTATPTSGLRVILDGSNSADPDDQSVTFRWTDGTTPIGTTPTLDYTGPAAGTRRISLTVTDPVGASATVTREVVLR